MTENKKPAKSRAQRGAEVAERQTTAGGSWEASPEAKSTALKLRIGAAALWVLAIALEIFVIVWALVPDEAFDNKRMWIVIGLVVLIGVITLIGSLLWKKANRYDPASEKDKVRFFVQNQLGVIITVLAFLPLIVLVLLDKNLSGKQKGVLGGVVAVVAVLVGIASADFNPPSTEQYSVETNVVKELTGKDEVYWVKGGSAFHVCRDVPDLSRSKAENIHTGTVAEAHQDGIPRLTKKWVSEATKNCGYTTADVDRVLGNVEDVDRTYDDGQVVDKSGELKVEASDVEEPAAATPSGQTGGDVATPRKSTPRSSTTRTPATSTR
ncbi:MAG: hypothetical protein QM658_05060 [Gordonia sp. (in: high G+C Gram-positive bacteria)]